jgi:adenine-specific DNA-methyltransferase
VRSAGLVFAPGIPALHQSEADWLRHLHSFVSRQEAVRHDDVLQETVIFRAVKGAVCGKVTVSSSRGPDDPAPISRVTDYAQIVQPEDAQVFIRIPVNDHADLIAEKMAVCQCTLADLGLAVSTGRVVDFRARAFLQDRPGKDTVPLIWPAHFHRGYIAWPREGTRKPEAIVNAETIRNQFIPNEHYVLTRRFSAKEERRRVVAAVHDASRIDAEVVGIENHLNYFHQHGRGLSIALARGLAAFLNSSIVDQFFRQFSGHTQVNSTDLRNMPYPTREQLEQIGARIGAEFPDQAAVDALVAAKLFGPDPVVSRLSDQVLRNGTSQESRPA